MQKWVKLMGVQPLLKDWADVLVVIRKGCTLIERVKLKSVILGVNGDSI